MKTIIKSILDRYVSYVILYAIFLAAALIPYYTKGAIILGGEGNYVLDFTDHLGKYGFMWCSFYGVGLPNMAPCGTGINILLLGLIEKMTGSIAITNFVLIFLMYFFPFLAMFLVAKQIKSSPFVSFAIALFYVVNPFIFYYLACMNQWNVFSMTAMPLFLWIILRYYRNNLKLFFFFGLVSALFSFAYTNPPMLVIIHLSMLLSVFISSYYHNKKFIFSEILQKYSIVFFSFILFNLWWILSFFIGSLSAATKIYSASFADSWLNITVQGAGAIIAKTFSLTTLIPIHIPWYNFFTFWYSTIFARLIVLIPFTLVVYFVLISRNKKTSNILTCSIFLTVLVVLFFVKGNSGFFGFIYNFAFKYVPFFYIFKSPVEKFGLFFIFIFTVLLLLILKEIHREEKYRPVLGIFSIYLIFCCTPFLTGNIIPDFNMGPPYGYVSRKYKDKADYIKTRRLINEDRRKYRTLSFPGGGNYQVCIPNYNNKKYTGMDPVLMNTNKPFIAVHHGIASLYKNIPSSNYKKRLGIYNIGKVVINEDLMPWFGAIEKESIAELKSIFSKSMPFKKSGVITLYENKNNFMPCIYVVDSTSAK